MQISRQKPIEAVLKSYRGQTITVSGVLHELAQKQIIVSRETVRHWMKEYGCEPLQGGLGLYHVPLVRRKNGQGSDPEQPETVAAQNAGPG